MSRPALIVGLVATLALGGCLGFPGRPGAAASACAPGQSAVLAARLFFGRNIGDAPGVSDADFSRFLDEEVTPRFPDGLTVFDAAGQWREGDRMVREPSKVLLLAVADAPETRARIAEIAAAYKRRFSQSAVLVLSEPACAAY